MNVLVILGHPNNASFNHAIAKTVVRKLELLGHKVNFHDLHNDNFNPLFSANELSRNALLDTETAQHCWEFQQADAIIVIHPNWWGMPPAILKGWIDRVIRPGIAYEFKEGDSGEGVPLGLLKAKLAIVINTSDTSEKRENDVFGDPLETLWKNCIFAFCGVTNFHRKTFRIVVTSNQEQRQQWLKETEIMIDELFKDK